MNIARRAELLASARAFFASRGYVEVETPVLVPSPGLDLHLDAFQVTPDRFLSTSPEYQMKRLLASGQTRIYQITRAFRAGERGERHNPEFTILELYRANAGVEEIMVDTEQLVARLSGGIVRIGSRAIDTRPPFRRMTVIEAYSSFAGVDRDETLRWAASDEDRFYRVLVDVVEPAIERLDHALFLTEYPSTQASLARKKPSDPLVAERFELYVAGLELCNGFGELTDPVEQRERFVKDRADRKAAGKPIYPIDERFVQALESGMPPAGGNAIGFDRLVALCCGTTNIGDVIAFPDDRL